MQKQIVAIKIALAKKQSLYSAFLGLLVSIDHVSAQQLSPYINLDIKTGVLVAASDTQDDAWYDQGTSQIDSLSGISLTDSVFSLNAATDSNLSYELKGQVSQNTENFAGITELWANYRPLTASKYRRKFRLGSFYPPMSLENTDTAWTSPYSQSFSAINSWFAEELKVTGAEMSFTRPGRAFRSKYTMTGVGGLFMGNDAIGSILSWRGFSVHSAQTHLGDRVYFADYPSLQTGALEKQPNWVNPNLELDNRIGHYYGGHLTHRNGFQARLYRYDNNGDPLVLKHQQYAWDTRFNSLALFYPINKNTQLLGQWLDGNTIMGDNAVNVDFQAWFALISHDFEAYKISVRYDNFETKDKDELEGDDNNGHGESITLALAKRLNPSFTIKTELTGMNSYRANRSDLNQDNYTKDALIKISGQYLW